MTRMWLVPPKIMCREHLLGEHSELHQAVGTIKRHPYGEAVMRGHVKGGVPDDIDTSLIEARHEALADALEARGYGHDSPLESFDDPGIGHLSADDVERNVDLLSRRCPDCAHRRAVMDL